MQREICTKLQIDFTGEFVGEAAEPLRPRRLGQLPTLWGAFCAGFARVKASSRSGEVGERQRCPEGLCCVCVIARLPGNYRPIAAHFSFSQTFSASFRRGLSIS